jgi:hypothetical protein
MKRLDLLGAWVALAIFVLAMLVFVLRLVGRAELGHWLAGVPLLLTAVPLLYLLVRAQAFGRPWIYFLQISLMLAFHAVELVLDYILTLDFRQVRWAVIGYVTLFFAGTGGMIGVASAAGKPFTISSIVLFLIMAVLAFVQRAKTGL